MAAKDTAPSLEILVRGPEGCFVWNGPPFGNGEPSVKLERVPCSRAKFSEDGSRLLVMKSDFVISIYDCSSFKEIKSFQVPNVLAAVLSPCGTYLQTFQKSSTPQDKNLVLWKIESGDSVYQQFQKNMTKTTWPSIRLSSDEAIACRMATNEIQFFDPKDFSKGIVHRIRVPGVAAVELSMVPGSHVAAFIPESKGVPASVQIFACGKEMQSQPVARRSFFRCDTVQLKWNRGSTGLLAVAQSDVDKTNQSYYGESKLNYLTTNGSHEGLVPLRKEGPIHDVQWSCSGSEFAVVYGFMPASATLFDKKCHPLLELGTGPYNTVRWNPKGKFLCLAVSFSDASDKIFTGGIDNDVKVWDIRKGEVTMTLEGHQDMITSMQLSPDGSYLLTNGMDNKLCIWDMRPYAPQNRCVKIFEGHQHNFEKNLLKCSWSPDGSKVTAGSADRMVYIWDTTSRRILYKLPGHAGSVNECVFHPTEPIIGSCSSDKQIYLGEI